MGTCPYCGSPMMDGALICPNCGNQLASEPSEVTETDEIDGSTDQPGFSGSATGHDGGAVGVDHVGGHDGGDGEPEELVEGATGETISVPDGDQEPSIEADASVPGSEIPISHGGGFQQRPPEDDSPGPSHLTNPPQVDRQPDDLPGMPGGQPDEGIGVDGSGRRFTPPLALALGILLITIVVIVAASLLFLDSDEDDDGDGEPNGDGPPPVLTGLHVDRENTVGSYTYEPIPGVQATVVVKNNDTETLSMDGHDIKLTVFVDSEKRAEDIHPLSGDLEAGKTTSYYVALDTSGFDIGDEILFSVLLRKDGGNTTVDLYSFKQTVG